MNQADYISIVKAWADGYPIEYKVQFAIKSAWAPCHFFPVATEDHEYRIKVPTLKIRVGLLGKEHVDPFIISSYISKDKRKGIEIENSPLFKKWITDWIDTEEVNKYYVHPTPIPHKYRDVIYAWINGAKIQKKVVGGTWTDCETLSGYLDTVSYRVKPKGYDIWGKPIMWLSQLLTTKKVRKSYSERTRGKHTPTKKD